MKSLALVPDELLRDSPLLQSSWFRAPILTILTSLTGHQFWHIFAISQLPLLSPLFALTLESLPGFEVFSSFSHLNIIHNLKVHAVSIPDPSFTQTMQWKKSFRTEEVLKTIWAPNKAFWTADSKLKGRSYLLKWYWVGKKHCNSCVKVPPCVYLITHSTTIDDDPKI